MELSLEERGAYNTLLDLIYCHDGAIDDDVHSVAGWLRVDPRVWKRLRQRLLDTKKLYCRDGKLRNERADTEVDKVLHRCLVASEAGLISAHKRYNGSKHFNGIRPTGVVTGVVTNHNNNKDSFLVSSATIAETPKVVGEIGSKKEIAQSAELAEIVRRKGWVP